jgi:hypothetical protein
MHMLWCTAGHMCYGQGILSPCHVGFLECGLFVLTAATMDTVMENYRSCREYGYLSLPPPWTLPALPAMAKIV